MGVDLGGTKIEVAVFDEAGKERLRRRIPTLHTGYDSEMERGEDVLAGARFLAECLEGSRHSAFRIAGSMEVLR